MKQISAQIRAQRAARPIASGTVAEMRAGMEAQQRGLPIPADVQREPLEIVGRPACRVSTPSNRSDRVTLYLHGGGYVMGSLATHAELMGRIARHTEAHVIGLDYRLAPEHPYPAAVDDAVAAYRWLLDQGIAARRIVIAGDSAGGGLSLATLLAARGDGLPLPAAAVLFSPWTDLTASGASVTSRRDADPMIGSDQLAPMAAIYAGSTPLAAPGVSPLFGDLRGLPPLLIQVGDNEVLLDDSTRLHERALAAGVDSTLRVFDGAFHVFQSVPALPEAREALDQVGEFFKSVMS
jgi:acetyl esterase/lipase